MRYVKLIAVLVMLIIIGCSKKDEKTFLDAADQKLKTNDIAGAIVEYNKFLEEFPEGQAAPKVLYELGKIYQSKLDKTVDENTSLTMAVDYYTQVAQKFPKAADAPTALFMSGFITANDLKKYDDAKIIYQKFLAAYPNHELAEAAKSEIETAGLSPEEIILRKQVAGK
ncbi:MAG: tetratricopeptide repeat protein [Ignavibacteriales bacterium]|nr:tetratricopeptide repeat protein [Ignavibacteriales bacterium]